MAQKPRLVKPHPANVTTIRKSKALKHDGIIIKCKSLKCKPCVQVKASKTTFRSNVFHVMLTRGAARDASSNAIFNTTELFEKVLAHLTNKDILRARGVNRHFNEVIMVSPSIQRKLFLRAEPVTATWAFGSGLGKIVKDTDGALTSEGYDWTIPAKLNEELFKPRIESRRYWFRYRLATCEPISLMKFPSLTKQDSIYHDMFVSNPPAKEIQYDIFYSKQREGGRRLVARRGNGWMKVIVRNGEGVTFGDIIRTFKARLGPGSRAKPISGYRLEVVTSRLWIPGVLFASEAEEATYVEKNVEKNHEGTDG